MKNILVLFGFIAIMLTACGDPSVDISQVEYVPRLVVEGYVYPGEPVKDIWLMKNIPMNTQVNAEDLYLTPDENLVVATINGIELHYNTEKMNYYTDDLQINYGEPYQLVVEAVVEGAALRTEIITTTPLEGFDLVKNELGELVYRDQQVYIDFHPSPQTGFYAFSVNAKDASFETFIFDNPYFPNIDSVDLADNFRNYKYQYNLLLNIEGTPQDTISYHLLGLDTWFYGNYDVIVYAGDKNMKDYILTARSVQEFDGNFHEPRYHFTGDGIGVFGSAIRDTLRFSLLPRE
nr:DUF4249 family protein [uncultured Sphaerochaeta sp.]